MPRRNYIPKPYHHKPSGRAAVILPDGLGGRHTIYLGVYGSPESDAEYERVIAEWLANGRSVPRQSPTSDTTINELLVDYRLWAEKHYLGEDGQPGQELENLNVALRPLRELYGHTIARQFGPLALRSLQEHLIKTGLCRNTINARVNRIRRFFKWAVSFERLPAAVHQALTNVPGLQRGRGHVKESQPVQSVPVEVVEATLPFMPAPVAALVRLQLLDGGRPSENLRMRGIDLDMTKTPWEYRPAHHKNKHRGKDRVIHIGPQAQEVIRPFLKADPQAYLFSPREYVENLRARRAAERKTKRTPSEMKKKRKAKPKRQPAELYNRRSYYVAVIRAIDKANTARACVACKKLAPKDRCAACQTAALPYWSPLQLRHTAGTIIRAKFGLEASRVSLGHTRVETTQIYAERDLAHAAKIASEIG